jgi:hypothetical protein
MTVLVMVKNYDQQVWGWNCTNDINAKFNKNKSNGSHVIKKKYTDVTHNDRGEVVLFTEERLIILCLNKHYFDFIPFKESPIHIR